MNQVDASKALMVKQSNQPIQLLKTGQLLALAENSQAGLIIQKRYHAEFVGPGAAVGGIFDLSCTAVFTLGKVEFWVPSTAAQRSQTYQNRIACIEKMRQIIDVQSPLRRAYLIIKQLSHWYSREEVATIPEEALGKLVAVLPETVACAWRQYAQNPDSLLEEEEFLVQPVA